ncbi:MAG: hypothetical protein NTW67_04800 [Candidatus Woesearchaeota archaeon]|nr:hypothetical protein [Candidatus Woesearchaeota archaeon]
MRGQTTVVLISVLLLAAIGTFLIFEYGPSGMAQIQKVSYPGQQTVQQPQCCRTGSVGYALSAHVPSGKCNTAFTNALVAVQTDCPTELGGTIEVSTCISTQTQSGNSCQVQLCCTTY